MTEENNKNLLGDIASAIVNEPQDLLKIAIINDNYEAGILKNLLIKAKRVHKNRVFQPNYYEGHAITVPVKCDVALIPAFNISKLSITPPPSCVCVKLLHKVNDEIVTNQLDIKQGSTFTINLS